MEVPMSPETIAAWWGAVLATIVFLWEIYKWFRSGARLRISAAKDMQVLGADGGLNDVLHVFLTVHNVGSAVTTITHLVGYNYKNHFFAFTGRRSGVFVVSPGSTAVYPHVIEPGKTWTAVVPQSDFEIASKNGKIMHVGVIHSMSKSPSVTKLVLTTRA